MQKLQNHLLFGTYQRLLHLQFQSSPSVGRSLDSYSGGQPEILSMIPSEKEFGSCYTIPLIFALQKGFGEIPISLAYACEHKKSTYSFSELYLCCKLEVGTQRWILPDKTQPTTSSKEAGQSVGGQDEDQWGNQGQTWPRFTGQWEQDWTKVRLRHQCSPQLGRAGLWWTLWPSSCSITGAGA